MNIKPTDLVLEIGSGNSPRRRSNIIADRLVHDNSQRAGKFTIVIDRPFVVADGYHLPFKDKSFDYVICSHVLEHLEDPKGFAREIMRVGKAGYIEVPNILGERLFGWDFHLWYCEFKKGNLLMTRKYEGERFGGFFHRLIVHAFWFRRFFEKYEHRFYIKYEWKENISMKVNNNANTESLVKQTDQELSYLLNQIEWDIDEDVLFYFTWIGKRIYRKITKILLRSIWMYKKTFQKQKILEQFKPYLMCPTCGGIRLSIKGLVVCNDCKTEYKIDGVIPVMLRKEEMKKGY